MYEMMILRFVLHRNQTLSQLETKISRVFEKQDAEENMRA
jgi:hypothetical protein